MVCSFPFHFGQTELVLKLPECALTLWVCCYTAAFYHFLWWILECSVQQRAKPWVWWITSRTQDYIWEGQGQHNSAPSLLQNWTPVKEIHQDTQNTTWSILQVSFQSFPCQTQKDKYRMIIKTHEVEAEVVFKKWKEFEGKTRGQQGQSSVQWRNKEFYDRIIQ